MVFPKARMVVSALLFVGWLGFLLYLVIQSRHLIVLSRPQFLAADLYAIAEVREGKDGPDPHVTVERVAWPPVEAKALAGQAVDVVNLATLREMNGFQGPGRYILALRHRPGREFEIAPVPPTRDDVRIYPLTPTTEAQLDEIVARKE